MDLIDPNKWNPIKGRIYDPNKRKGYVEAVDSLINRVATSGLRKSAEFGLPPKKKRTSTHERDRRTALEEMVFARILGIAQQAAEKYPKKRNAGFDAVNAAYPGIDADLDEIFKNHRDTDLGREVLENADILVGRRHIGDYTKQELVAMQQAKIAKIPKVPGTNLPAKDLTDKEKKYIRTTESPGIPRDLRVHFKTKGLSASNENYNNIQGPDLGLQYKKVEIPSPDGSKVKVNLNILLDAHGRLQEDMLFPTSSNTYIKKRAKILRDAFAETFAGNQIFGDTLGMGKKLAAWMDLERYQPGRYRKRLSVDQQKKSGIEQLYGTREGMVRRNQITTDIAKKEFASAMNEKIAKHFQEKPGKQTPDYTGKEIAKAVGINYDDCFAPGAKKIPENFDGYRAFLLFNGINPDDNIKDPKKRKANADKRKAQITSVTNTYYIGYGFREFRFPIKDEIGAPQLGQGMLEYDDTGFTPDQKAAEAFMKDMLDKIGQKMFTGNSYTLGLGMKTEVIQGPDGVRVKVTYKDGRVLYYDTDNYWDVEARTMSAAGAAAMHNQIQRLAHDPINFAVGWYYQGVGDAMINMIPGARSAYNSTYNILIKRNSFLPKSDQLSAKALKDWSNLIIKRTILAPMYMYDPESKNKLAIPRYAYLIRSGINWGIDSLAGTELQPGVLDKLLMKTGAKEWFWDPLSINARGEKGDVKQRAWKPRIFKSVMRRRRQAERQSIFDLAFKMGYGIFVNMIGARLLNIVTKFPAVSRVVYGVGQFRTLPMRAFNAGFRKLRVNGFVESLTSDPSTYMGTRPPVEHSSLWKKSFLGDSNLYRTTQSMTSEGWVWETKLQTGFRANLYKAFGRFFSQNGFTTLGNNLKLAWKTGGVITKTLGQAVIPAVLAGVVFNSPLAFAVAAIGAGVPAGFMNFATLAKSFPYFTTTRVGAHFDTLSKILYAKTHAEAAIVLNPQSGTFATLPKFFGLEHQIYEKVTLNTGVKAWQMKNDGIARFLSNHANIRGILKGTGRATYAFSIIYALTGSYVWAGAAAVGTIAGSIVYENVLKVMAEKLPGLAGKLTAISGTASAVGSVAMGGVTLALGLNFIREGFRAALAGKEEWEEWKNENFGGVISTSFSLMTMLGTITSLVTIGTAGTAIGHGITNLLAHYGVKSTVSIVAKFPLFARIGAIIGFVIGAIIGGIFGAQLGGMIGGTILGAVGGVAGGVIAGAIGGSVVPIVGSIIGAIVGGIIGAVSGVIIEKIIRPRLEGLVQGFKSAFNIIGNALNILQAIKMLLSGDLAEVGVGALMLCLAGVFTFSTLTTSSMTAASHIETEWTESGGGELLPGRELVTEISDFKKEFISLENDNTLVFRISTSNTKSTGEDILLTFEDTLNISGYTDITVEASSDVSISQSSTQLQVNENDATTLTPGERKELTIKFISTTTSFIGDNGIIANQNNERLCNHGIAKGSDFSASDTVCLDKNGEITSQFTSGEFVDCGGESPIQIGIRDTETKLLPMSSRSGSCIRPTQICLHWSAGSNAPGARYGIWSTLAARGVSCHLNIDPSGTLQALGLYDSYVEMSWCQGPVFNVNSISIEIAGSNFDKTHARHVTCHGSTCTIDGGPNESGFRPPTAEQYERVEEAVCWLMQKYNIGIDGITGHHFAPYQARYEDYATPTCMTPHPKYGKYGCKWDPGYLWLREFKENLDCTKY